MLLLKSVLMLLLLVGPVAHAQLPNVPFDKPTLDLFARYPETDESKTVFYSHAYRQGLDKSNLVFFSTWFLGGKPGTVMKMTVNAQGRVYTVLSVYNWTEQNSKWQQLSEGDSQSLLAALKTLPDTPDAPPLPFLVIASFKLDGKWHTRLYDRRNPPGGLTTIYHLAHSVMDAN